MRRRLTIGVMAVGAVMALVGLRFATANAGEPMDPHTLRLMMSEGKAIQPDTKSPKWKPISDDLAMWVDTSEQFGMRGRLYVRLGPLWYPVAVDGAADLKGPVFVK